MIPSLSAKGLYLLCLLLTCGLIACDMMSRAALVDAATKVETSDVPRGSLPVSPDARRRWTVLPAAALDARWWIIHAEEGLKMGRVHETHLDNHPSGREVHWSSGPVWLLEGIAGITAFFTGNSPLEEIQKAPLWFGPVVFLMLAALVSLLVGPRFGWGYAGFLILLFATSFPVYEAFRTGDADHHGLAVMFVLGSVLALVGGGAGWSLPVSKKKENREQGMPVPCFATARKSFVLAGLLGSAALWVSAATMLPVLLASAAGAIASSLLKPDDNAVLRPELWRLWGLWGAVGSLAFYLLEYFPNHMGWRLEVNHPVYAIAWLAGGDLLCRICRKFSGGKILAGSIQDSILFAASLIGVLIPPMLIFLNPEYFFWIADRFLFTLHKEHIREIGSLWTAVMRQGDWTGFFEYLVWPGFALVSLATLVILAKPCKAWFPILAFSSIVAGAIQILALAQIRWTVLAIILWSVCILVVLVIFFGKQYSGHPSRFVPGMLAAWGLAGLLAFPLQSVRAALTPGDVAKNLPQSLVPTILLRDIAHRLVEADPHRVPVVLTDPTSATELAYYGGIRTLGTLYWENLPGLLRTATIFASPTEETTFVRLKAAGITHIVIPSWDDFSDLSAFSRLLQQKDAPFLQKVLDGQSHPAWLREYAYPIPESFGIPDERIRIFEVLSN